APRLTTNVVPTSQAKPLKTFIRACRTAEAGLVQGVAGSLQVARGYRRLCRLDRVGDPLALQGHMVDQAREQLAAALGADPGDLPIVPFDPGGNQSKRLGGYAYKTERRNTVQV